MPTYYHNEENYMSPGQGVILFHTQDGDKYIKLIDVRSCSIERTYDGFPGSFENKRVTCDVEGIEVCFCNKNQEIDESEVMNLLEE